MTPPRERKVVLRPSGSERESAISDRRKRRGWDWDWDWDWDDECRSRSRRQTHPSP